MSEREEFEKAWNNRPWITEEEADKDRAWRWWQARAARSPYDKYGLALMMISQGCSDPVGIADRALAKGWTCKGCGWRGEMPNTKVLPDSMGTAQVPCCPDCDQHAALSCRRDPVGGGKQP